MKIFDFKKHIFDNFFSGEKRFGLNSNLKRDWKIIIIIFLAINAFTLTYSYYFFFGTISDDIFAIKQDEEVTIDFFNRSKLTKGLNNFENKVGCSLDVKETDLKTKDPSK